MSEREAAFPARDRYVFEQFVATRRYQPTLAFSPDGSQIAYSTNTSGQFNLWRQSSDGGYPHQLTTFEDRTVRDVAWSPDGETILFTADRDGDEFHQLYTIPARGGWPRALTDAPEVQHYLASEPWSPDGRTIAYAGNDRAPTDQDVILRDVAGGEVGRPLTGDASFFAVAWSPDGSLLTAVELRGNTDGDVHVISLRDGSTRLVTAHEGETKFFPGPWAADGSGFYLVTDEGREFQGLAFHDLTTDGRRWIETPEWDVDVVADSTGGGRVLAWVVNEDGSSRLRVRDLATGGDVALPALPEGVVEVVRVSPEGRKVGMLLTQPDHPMELFVIDLAGGSSTQLTHGFLGGIDPVDLIRPALVRYPTFDGRKIPAFLSRPRGDGPFPAILSIHGGPEGQERPEYSALYQYLLHRGIAVLAPNVRGSTGYGKSYQKLIHRDWGGGDLRDFEAAVRFLHGLDWVDPNRIGVYGGSYGGFATLSCVSRLPDYWAAAVDIVGPANLVTFAKAVPPTWRRFMADWVGDPETESDFLLERSPITYADRITAPLFVIQGANDPRVVRAESDQIVERLRARGVPVRYDVYEDEGHGFTKRANQVKAMRDAAAFFEEHLVAR
jgi:dipeptidyl aminopeptidase/acylaminoacyl peptidase